MSKYQLAKLAESSYPSVHRILNQLEDANLVVGTTVKKYQDIIMIWQRWKPIQYKRDYMIRNPLDILRSSKLRYALTTYQGENIVQNYLFPSRIDFYVYKEDMIAWHRLLTENGLVGRGNVRIVITDDHVFYNSQNVKDLNVVSIPQLIVDLFREGGVCIEGATNLLEKVT